MSLLPASKELLRLGAIRVKARVGERGYPVTRVETLDGSRGHPRRMGRQTWSREKLGRVRLRRPNCLRGIFRPLGPSSALCHGGRCLFRVALRFPHPSRGSASALGPAQPDALQHQNRLRNSTVLFT